MKEREEELQRELAERRAQVRREKGRGMGVAQEQGGRKALLVAVLVVVVLIAAALTAMTR